MSCKSCQSENQRKFSSEINIHFPGLTSLDKPTVWAFPEIMVCLDCGFAEFLIGQTELQLLAAGVDAHQTAA